MIRLTRLLSGDVSKRLPHKIAVLNLTTECNLFCKHCYIDGGRRKEELKKDEAFRVIKELASLDFKLVLFSGGEPLLYPHLFPLNALCKDYGIKTCLSSNGSLCEDFGWKIKGGDFDYVGISIDGVREIHDKFRAIPGAFDKAINGLRALKRWGVKRGMRFTLSRENIRSLPSVIELALKEELERFCLYHLVWTGRAASDLDIKNDERKRAIGYLIQKIKDGMKIEVLTACNPCDGVYLKEKGASLRKEGEFGCSAGKRIISIAPNGDVYPCQFFKRSLGNIKKASLSEILNNDFIRLLNDRNALKGKCGGCVYKDLCGGCRVRAYAKTGDYFKEDPACYI